MQNPESFYGLGFYVLGMAMLFRLGFFEEKRILKLIGCLLYLIASEAFCIFSSKSKPSDMISVVFFLVVFLVFFYLIFQDKLMVFLSEPKQKLSLADKGLSDTESDYILEVVKGKSVKDTAFEAGVSESTVRNLLARGYAKLGVTNRAGLSALAEKFKIIP